MFGKKKPKPFKPVTFKGPFTRVTVHEHHLEFRHGWPYTKKGYIELDNIASIDYTALNNNLRVGTKDGVSHVLVLWSGGKCRDLIMQLKFTQLYAPA